MITVLLPAALRSLADERVQIELKDSGSTVKGTLGAVFNRYPWLRDRILNEEGEVRHHVNIFVGEESIRFREGLQTPVADGETVSIIPAVSGGSVDSNRG